MDAADTKSYHKVHISDLKADCSSKGISTRGTRYGLVCRLLNYHKACLEAEYLKERSTGSGYARDSTKGEKLFYRIKIYDAHIATEKGLASEPSKDAAAEALESGKYENKDARIYKWLLGQVDHANERAKEQEAFLNKFSAADKLASD